MMISSFAFAGLPTYFFYNNKTFKLSSITLSNTSGLADYTNIPTPDPRTWVKTDYGSSLVVRRYEGIYSCATCPSGTYAVSNYFIGNYVVETTPTCLAPNSITDGECIAPPTCQFGYHNDTTTAKTCVPDVTCPPSMNYFTKVTGTFSFDIKTCVPNRDLTPADCASKGGTYADLSNLGSRINAVSTMGNLVTAYGSGCYDLNYIQNISADNAIAMALSFFTAKIDKAFLAQLGKSIYSGGKTIADGILDFFKSNPTAQQVGLLEYKPNFIDVKIQPDGTYAVMDWQVRNQIWEDLGGGNVVQKPYAVDTPDIIPNNVYLGGDIYKVQSNLIGTKSFLDNPQILSVPDNLPINGVSTSTLDLKNSLYGSEISTFPVNSTVLERTALPSGETLTKTVSKINYADGSYTQITSLERKFADATKTYEITTTAPIETTNGIKVFENKTTVTTNSNNVVNNVVNSPSTVSYVNSSGAVTTSTNSSVSNSNTISSTSSPINLSQLQAGLDKINKQLSDLDKAMTDSVKDAPKAIAELNTAIDNFKTGMSDYSSVLDNAVTFAGGMKDKMLGLEQQLNDALAVFDDKPQIHIQNGACPFTSHWYGKEVVVDPCMFVAPYRPILSAFLTFFMSVGVLLFCLKFFFRIG